MLTYLLICDNAHCVGLTTAPARVLNREAEHRQL